jgi:polyferredoxin
MTPRGWIAAALVLAALAGVAAGESRFPPPEFETGHRLPQTSYPSARAAWLGWADVAALTVALGLAAWFALRRRSRRALAALSVVSLAYFGFYRAGCVCPIGAIQNVAEALADGRYALPATVALFFILPLAAALLFGRVFCGGVCPLGAAQDVVLVRAARLPAWLEGALGVAPFLYLGLAVLYAATGSDYLICRYDPFVAFFRLSGPAPMLLFGGAVLLVSMFIGRPYCRFACPYGALLGIAARWAWRRATITPDTCIDCSLCREACPFGSIRVPSPAGLEEGK